MNRRSLTTLAAVALAGAFLTRNACAAGHDFPAGSPKFETKYKAALSEAKKTGKPALLVFSASWCAPCQANKKNVYPSAAVQPYHDKFVWAYLDTDEEANGTALKNYSKDGSIPHIQFLSKDGAPIDSLIGGTKPEVFAKKLQEVLGKAGAAPASAPEKPAAGLAPKKPAATTPEKKKS